MVVLRAALGGDAISEPNPDIAERIPNKFHPFRPPRTSPPAMSLARPLRRPPLCIRRPRNYSSTTPLRRAPIQYTPTCPPPTDACACSPPGLDIDRTSPLLNTMAAHSAHVVVCTGKDDWPSRIDDSPGAAGDFVRGVRGEIGKGGRAFDVRTPHPEPTVHPIDTHSPSTTSS